MSLDKSKFTDLPEKFDRQYEEIIDGFNIPDYLLEAADEALGQSEVPEVTPCEFGIHAHIAYADAAQSLVQQECDIELPVRVTKPDGTQGIGRIDVIIGNKIVDFKTNDMRNWPEIEAKTYGQSHGQQIQEYVESPDTPRDAQGWIVASVPPTSGSVRNAYESSLDEYGVSVRFSESEDPESIGEIVKQIVDGVNGQVPSDLEDFS